MTADRRVWARAVARLRATARAWLVRSANLGSRVLGRPSRPGKTEAAVATPAARKPQAGAEDLRLARALANEGNWAGVDKVCANSRTAGTANPQLDNLHGRALMALGRLDEAEELYSGLIEATPNAPAGYLGAARVAEARGDWEACAAVCSRAGEVQKTHPQVTLLHGQALLELRRFAPLARLLSDYFHASGIMHRDGTAGPAVTDRRVALAPLFDLFWKATIAQGDYDRAQKFRRALALARTQGPAMTTLYGGLALHMPFFDNSVLGDI
ncbi:MAG: hypothetical protein K0U74_17685 [Alphaproteobacteria bacterium]|nr:hypothetical protein [Alphaproteobacteria bacterium]